MTAAQIPLKHVASLNPEVLDENTDPEYAFHYVDISNTGRGELPEEPQLMTFGSAPSRARRVLRPGDTILSTVRTYLRAVWTVRDAADRLVASTGFVCLRPRATVDPRFLGWVAQADTVIEEIVARSVGVSYPAINPSEVGRIKVPELPLSHQRAIADHLDRETGRIDALIAAKQRMVELLQERAIAVVEDGFLETTWSSVTLSRVIKHIEQGWSPQCDARPPFDNEWGVFKVGCVNRGEFRPDEVKALPRDTSPRTEYEVRDGDLLVSRANTRDLVGSAAVASGVRPRSLLCDKLYRITLNEARVESRFVCLYLQTRAAREQIELDATGASDSMQNVGQDTVRRLTLPLPDLEAQAVFVGRCLRERERIAKLISSVQQQTNLLQERRQALITAAVTGQIDIPGAA